MSLDFFFKVVFILIQKCFIYFLIIKLINNVLVYQNNLKRLVSSKTNFCFFFVFKPKIKIIKFDNIMFKDIFLFNKKSYNSLRKKTIINSLISVVKRIKLH